MTADYRSPASHAPLRGLLEIIHHAEEYKSIALFDCVRDLAEVAAPSLHDELQVYIIGTRQHVGAAVPVQYRTYRDGEVAEAKAIIEKHAYGDFDEAMCDLERDLLYYDIPRGEESFLTDIYRPELFENNKDREIWSELRAVLKRWGKIGTFDSVADHTIHDAVEKLRNYQQKSFGVFVPVLVATYLKKTPEGSHGVSVRLAWVDEGLVVTTRAPFYEELDDYFIRQSPVRTRQDFTANCFPEKIADYELAGVTGTELFRYEVESFR